MANVDPVPIPASWLPEQASEVAKSVTLQVVLKKETPPVIPEVKEGEVEAAAATTDKEKIKKPKKDEISPLDLAAKKAKKGKIK